MVHERRIRNSDEVVELKVSGQVRLGNLVMFDTKTGSHWLQETGKSLEGDHQGKVLTDMAAETWQEHVRWDEWVKAHPDSKILVCRHCDEVGDR
ncbi:MAG: DUF3179 domain-containing protein [Planctomycetaceae bacterium]|nr:DUF3179 domain-containing protein [Planctomycetaceae bacterium]